MTETKKNNKKRRWGWWIAAGVVVVVGLIVGLQIYRNSQATQETLANLETEPYARQTLKINIYGTGTVESAQTAVLTWSASGIIDVIQVSLGEDVVKDQVLMTLDSESVSTDILQAQIDVINIGNSLDDLYANWQADLAQAKLDLLNAEEDLEDLERDRLIMNYQRCSDERLEELEDDLEQAERFYKFRQNSDTLRAVNTAQANLDYCRADYTEREITEAELKVELGDARVVDLQKKVDTLSEGPDPDQVTILETQLEMAQSRLDSALIKAPFAGTVTILPVQEGDLVQSGAQAVQLDDFSSLFLSVKISEVDIPMVMVGQPVELVFDAFYEETYIGEVVEIAPVGQAVQGIAEYSVRIEMAAANGRIKPGMTAAINIIAEERSDVFVISNDAIVMIDGKEHVYVRRNGGFESVPVTLGGYSDFYSEVISAEIDEGELIVLNPPSALTGQNSLSGSSTGGFGGFGN